MKILKYVLFSLLVLFIVFCWVIFHEYKDAVMILKPLPIVFTYVTEKTLISGTTKYVEFEKIKRKLPKEFKTPECSNLLGNMTVGQWIRKAVAAENSGIFLQKETTIIKDLFDFWNKRGIQTSLWRSDMKCGYYVPQEKPKNSTWPQVGSWCDKDSEHPCCNHLYSGLCSEASPTTCDCPACIDLRKLIFEEVSEWEVKDSRCEWRNYSAHEACQLFASSKFKDLYFIGDSFVRNMYGAFLMLLAEDPVHGAWRRDLPLEWHEICSGAQRFFWKECRRAPFAIDLEIGANNWQICKEMNEIPFKARFITMVGRTYSFLNTIKKLIGAEGSLILFGSGLHMDCDAKLVINKYMEPALAKIRDYYRNSKSMLNDFRGDVATKPEDCTWPQIIFLSTVRTGILKPVQHLRTQNNEKCTEFNRQMRSYCQENKIEFIDFMPLTTNVFSFDGTHYAYDVNFMKIQILLNYIASIQNN